MIRKTGGIGIATENNCAIEFIDGRFYRIIRSKRHARAYQVNKHGGEVVAKQIRLQKQLARVESLAHRRRSTDGHTCWVVESAEDGLAIFHNFALPARFG